MGRIADKILKQADEQARWYTWTKLEDIAKITDDLREVRNDYETHSTILIDKFNEKGKNVEIPLVASDSFRRLGSEINRENYMVLVWYSGSGKDIEAIGTLVRKDISQKKIKEVKDSNFEVL